MLSRRSMIVRADTECVINDITTVYGKVGVPISKCHVGKPVYRLLTQHCSISPIPGFSF